MSKNFELLYNIGNEKGLFQTLDGWEEVSEARSGAEPNAGVAEKEGEEPLPPGLRQDPLPDVFCSISETVGPLGPFHSDFDALLEPLVREQRGPLSGTLADRFPISRNPLTRMGAPSAPAWLGPQVERETTVDRGAEVEVEWDPQASERVVLPESHRQEVPRSGGTSPADRRRSSFAGESKSIGRSKTRVQPGGAHRDARRELIAREEELKLVQRIFLGSGSTTRVALFSGLEQDGGCASICVRTAEILSTQAEGPVCLVDADFETPSLHEYLGLSNDKGLAEATLGSAPIQEFAQQLALPNLWFVPGGHGASRLDFAKTSDQLRTRIEELRNAYRYVVVHSGPLWLNGNAVQLSKWTDGVVLVLEANSTRRDTARRIKESLTVANAKVLGAVLNNRSYPIPAALYSRL
jgi:Mrp family chromosome partitioning ATPase